MKWKRNCPKCNKEIIYCNKRSFYYAIKNQTGCVSCGKSGIKCPWVSISNKNRVWSEQTKQKMSKLFSGSGNPMFGTKGGMKGKNQSDFQKENQSKYMKNRWAKEKGVLVKNLHKNWSEFRKYRAKVDKLTKQQPLYILENFDKRGKAGEDGAYHVDHIISVYNGFRKNMPALEIANIKNLQMLPWLENQIKWYK